MAKYALRLQMRTIEESMKTIETFDDVGEFFNRIEEICYDKGMQLVKISKCEFVDDSIGWKHMHHLTAVRNISRMGMLGQRYTIGFVNIEE